MICSFRPGIYNSSNDNRRHYHRWRYIVLCAGIAVGHLFVENVDLMWCRVLECLVSVRLPGVVWCIGVSGDLIVDVELTDVLWGVVLVGGIFVGDEELPGVMWSTEVLGYLVVVDVELSDLMRGVVRVLGVVLAAVHVALVVQIV